MDIIYLHHSGFAVLEDNITIIIDFYEDSESESTGILHKNILSRKGPIYVLSSHFHQDHFNKQIFNWSQNRNDITYILSYDIYKRRRIEKQAAIWLHKGDCFADNNIKVKAFGSTDEGVSFVIEVKGRTLFHAGDLNNWHWMEESTEEEWTRDEQKFISEIDSIKEEYKAIDIAMFPIDPRLGKEYARGGKQFVEKIKTKIFIPMHFWNNFEKANQFQDYLESHGIKSPRISFRGQIFNNI